MDNPVGFVVNDDGTLVKSAQYHKLQFATPQLKVQEGGVQQFVISVNFGVCVGGGGRHITEVNMYCVHTSFLSWSRYSGIDMIMNCMYREAKGKIITCINTN